MGSCQTAGVGRGADFSRGEGIEGQNFLRPTRCSRNTDLGREPRIFERATILAGTLEAIRRAPSCKKRLAGTEARAVRGHGQERLTLCRTGGPFFFGSRNPRSSTRRKGAGQIIRRAD